MTYSSETPLLLDTGVFSLLFKPNDSRRALYFPDLKGHILAVSFITVGEIYRWAILRRWQSERVKKLEEP